MSIIHRLTWAARRKESRRSQVPALSDQRSRAAIFLDELRRMLREDYLGLWVVVGLAQTALRPAGDHEVRRLVLSTLEHLLEHDEIELGFPTGTGGFVPWTESPKDALEKIAREWEALGRDPNIGEVVWLNSPDAAPPRPPRRVLDPTAVDDPTVTGT